MTVQTDFGDGVFRLHDRPNTFQLFQSRADALLPMPVGAHGIDNVVGAIFRIETALLILLKPPLGNFRSKSIHNICGDRMGYCVCQNACVFSFICALNAQAFNCLSIGTCVHACAEAMFWVAEDGR